METPRSSVEWPARHASIRTQRQARRSSPSACWMRLGKPPRRRSASSLRRNAIWRRTTPDLGPMNGRDQRGYAMAALLVTLSVMAVLMTAIMPAWRHIAQRDREEEMIFRAKQYARAIGLFQKKGGPGVLPQNID